jgi:Zn2+/Cd2+-exporting ATPase
VIALGVIVLLSVASVAGWTHIGTAIALHEGSTLVVVLNALRLLRYKG